jgi:DNA-3-methyladenine glycosylase I
MKKRSLKTAPAACPWPGDDALMKAYHDTEWGKPLYDDDQLFEFLILETMQAGLSWRCVLHKRENFRKAFDRFDAKKVAKYGVAERKRLLNDAGIIRNRLKIDATVSNAQAFLQMRKKHGSFSKYIWGMIGGKPIVNRLKSLKELPATTRESDAISKQMKLDGFKFVGSTVIYAHMQATGMVNDHLETCFRHKECRG